MPALRPRRSFQAASGSVECRRSAGMAVAARRSAKGGFLPVRFLTGIRAEGTFASSHVWPKRDWRLSGVQGAKRTIARKEPHHPISKPQSDQEAVFEQTEPHLRRKFELASADGSMAPEGPRVSQTRTENTPGGCDRRTNDVADGPDDCDSGC